MGAVTTGALLVWALANAGGVIDGTPVVERTSWVAPLGLSLDLRIDGFSLLMVLLVSGIGVLIHLYATRYFGAGKAGLNRLAGLLVLFSAAMLGVVTASNLLVLYIAWELTSVTSYLLVGWNDTDAKARAAALQAILITGTGGLAMLGGFVVIGQVAGTYDIAAIVADPPTGAAVEGALVLILIGAFAKSAQWPFSSWLPGAMVAPTPVSAYLHSATMVKAGVYLIARLAPAFAEQGLWRPIVLSIGLVTMISGGWRALRQFDLKRILAFGTVSQLGFMIVLLGAGVPEATMAGVAVLFAHALFKATLFLVVGIVDHQAHTRDIRALGRYGPGWTGPRIAAAIAGASMAGIPLLFGFIAKEAAYESWVHGDLAAGPIVLAGLVTGSILTFAYTARLLLGAFRPGVGFEGEIPDEQGTVVEPVAEPPAPSFSFWAPAGLLTIFTVVLGVLPDLASDLVMAGATSLDPTYEATYLKLWHGFNLALGLSALTVASGVALVLGAKALARVQQRLQAPFDGNHVYQGALRALNVTADRSTGLLQNGSMPVYAGVIMATSAILPGLHLIGAPWPSALDWFSAPGEVPVVALIVVAGFVASVVRHRLAAVLALGAVGYGMALIFVIQGAPDLALTTVSIETLAAIVFVLVLRSLPLRFEEAPTRFGRSARIAVSVTVAAFVFVFALLLTDLRTQPPVSDEMLARSAPEAGGNNVVNVILVDFRGIDTLGEITVLAVAAVGAVSLARVGRKETKEAGDPGGSDEDAGGTPAREGEQEVLG